MKIHELLSELQRTVKVPKGQMNNFGNYKYRSCEDIVEAVKLHLPEGATIVLSDEIVPVGTRYYVKAIATLTLGDESVFAVAYAREEEDKKGMDGSQITGSASSYARKYALNGLLLIDDTKDADTQDNTKEEKKPTTEDPILTEIKANLTTLGIKPATQGEASKAILELTGLQFTPENYKQIQSKLVDEIYERNK